MSFSSAYQFDISIIDFFHNCVEFSTLARIQAIVMPIIIWSLYYTLRSKQNQRFQSTIMEGLCVTNPI